MWKHPDLEGYQGLLAFSSLLYQNTKDKLKTVPLKKNIPDRTLPGIDINSVLEMFKESSKGEVSLLIQGVLSEMIYGNDLSLREIAKKFGIPKSSLHRLLQRVRRDQS